MCGLRGKNINKPKKEKSMRRNDLFIGLVAMSLLLTGCDSIEDGLYSPGVLGTFNEEDLTEMQPTSGDKFEKFADNPFVKTVQQPVSTFSVDADGASYAIVRRSKKVGREIDPSSVRVEEFLNYFTFDYQLPTGDETVAINAEVGDCPWNAKHHLLRLGIKGKELAVNEVPRANYVFLVDVSGSMYSDDKLPMLKKGLTELLNKLDPDDRISIITYSGQVEKLLESTTVRHADKIRAAINKLEADGYTDGGKALKMAYEEALANYDQTRNNRVILGTDGDFNVGVTSTEALVEMVESYARKGIYMTCLGFGFGNLNDAMMEKVSNSGNGTYHYIDSENELMKVFVHESSRFVSVANDAKCQVTFDSTLVSQYRLIGYENRIMNKEDFENDKKDAGEIGAGQTITALYEIVLKDDKPEGFASQPFVTFDFRYKKALNGESRPLQLTMNAGKIFEKYDRPDDFYFAAGVAAYGMLLRNSPYKGNATLDMARSLVKQGLTFDPHGYRAELLRMMDR